MTHDRHRRPAPHRPRPDRAAARRSPRPPAAAAVRRPRPVRRLAGADGARRPRPGAVGRAALRPDPARADHPRPGRRRDELRGAAALDPAAGEARPRHHLQRARRRLLRRRDPRAARPAGRRWSLRIGADGRRHRALRAGQRALHRRPVRPRPARRPDDRPARAHRPLAAAGAHRPRGVRRRLRPAARRRARPRHRPLRAAIGPLTQLMLPWFTVALPGATTVVSAGAGAPSSSADQASPRPCRRATDGGLQVQVEGELIVDHRSCVPLVALPARDCRWFRDRR